MLLLKPHGILSILVFSTMLFASQAISAPRQAEFQVAQINLELGIDDGSIIRLLRRHGYSEIRITKRGFSKVRAEACFEGGRYFVSVKRLGVRIRRGAKIGECRPELSLKEIIKKLKSDGFSRISIVEGDTDEIQVVACDRNRRVRLLMNKYGDTVKQKEVGRCRRDIEFADIRQLLREDGYNRMKLVAEREGRFIVEACQRDRRVRLRVNRRGRIRRQRTIGDCKPPINPGDIAKIIAKRGYDRINVLDKKLPVYLAEACRGTTLLRIRMNRFGDIVKERETGECDPPLNRRQIAELLRDLGAHRFKIEERGNKGFFATSCVKLRRTEFTIDPYGDILDRRVTGRCDPPPRLRRVIRDFKERGLSDLRVYVEGCRRNRRVRFQIDGFGEVVDRERIGRCR